MRTLRKADPQLRRVPFCAVADVAVRADRYMRMGVLLFAPAAVPPLTPFTLSSRQSHSIPDNLVALLGHSRAWNCSSDTHGLRWRIRRAGFGCQANTA